MGVIITYSSNTEAPHCRRASLLLTEILGFFTLPLQWALLGRISSLSSFLTLGKIPRTMVTYEKLKRHVSWATPGAHHDYLAENGNLPSELPLTGSSLVGCLPSTIMMAVQ